MSAAMRRILPFVLLILVALPAFGQQRGDTIAKFGTGKVTIQGGAARHEFNVEIARTPDQHRQGLMWRTKLAPDAGMLFIYGGEQPVSMWMSNTLIPLDMLFIAGDGRIVRIAERAVPRSEEIISSGRPVTMALELNGGTAARLGLKPGDRVSYTESKR
jgi:uncharacterized membrane protein (UPF0127 family)